MHLVVPQDCLFKFETVLIPVRASKLLVQIILLVNSGNDIVFVLGLSFSELDSGVVTL